MITMAWLTPLSVISANSWTRPDLTGATWARFDIPHPSPDQLGAAFLIAGLIAAAVVALNDLPGAIRCHTVAAFQRMDRLADPTPTEQETRRG